MAIYFGSTQNVSALVICAFNITILYTSMRVVCFKKLVLEVAEKILKKLCAPIDPFPSSPLLCCRLI